MPPIQKLPAARILDEVVRVLEHLPSAPRVLPRLKRLLSDGNSAMSEVVEMVRLDPGIAARVLQFGNSAYFSHGLRCYTVEEAVHRVGYDQIYQLVATAVASQVLVRPLASYALEADTLWESSIACALAAETIAGRIGQDQNIAYTVGLLHGIGMVAIDHWSERQGHELRFVSKGFPLDWCESERHELGFHQAEAGAAVLRGWAFPPAMCEPVRWQYLPNGTAAHFPLAALLHAAKWLRSRIIHPLAPIPALPAPLLARLKFSQRQLDRLVDPVAYQLRDIMRQLAPREQTVSIEFPGGRRDIPSVVVEGR